MTVIHIFPGWVNDAEPGASPYACLISILTYSFFAVVQVKKARKSGKVTSQKTQVSTSVCCGRDGMSNFVSCFLSLTGPTQDRFSSRGN